MNVRLLFVVVLAVLVPSTSFSKDLFVDPSGNDAVTYAQNSATTPWRTIGRAAWGSTSRTSPNSAEAAKGGDVVKITAGTYATTGSGDRFIPAYHPANSGTASAPIRFEAQGTVVLTFSSGVGPMIGAGFGGRHYIHWSGVTIFESSAPTTSDTGPAVWGESNGGLIENCLLVGNPNWQARVGDNYSGVRVHGSIGMVIRNNTIRNYGGQSGDENHNGIETYWAPGLVVENNDIDNSGVGIYLKANFNNGSGLTHYGPQTIRFNDIHHSDGDGIRVFRSVYSAAQPLVIAQNIIRDNRLDGVRIHQFGSGSVNDEPQHVKVINNTIVRNGQSALSTGGSYGVPVPNSGHVLWNNIGSTSSFGVVFEQAASHLTKAKYDFDRNVYHAFTTFAWLAGDDATLAQWRATGQDAASVVGDPLFVSATDLRLRSGSPAQSVGRARYGVGGPDGTVIPAGAYITGNEVIGPSMTPPPPPPPPGPVDCVVSDWSLQSAGPWSACVNNQQTRQETWARTILTPPANGGAACPALTETRTGTQACTPTPAGFQGRLWAQSNFADGDLRLTLRLPANATLPTVGTGVTVTINGAPRVGSVAVVTPGFYEGGDHRVQLRFDGVAAYTVSVSVP